jgi:hypothetical protein
MKNEDRPSAVVLPSSPREMFPLVRQLRLRMRSRIEQDDFDSFTAVACHDVIGIRKTIRLNSVPSRFYCRCNPFDAITEALMIVIPRDGVDLRPDSIRGAKGIRMPHRALRHPTGSSCCGSEYFRLELDVVSGAKSECERIFLMTRDHRRGDAFLSVLAYPRRNR